MRIRQGQCADLPDLSDDELAAQIRYAIGHGWVIGVEWTDDPHPRNMYWEMWDQPRFGVERPEQVLDILLVAFQPIARLMRPMTRLLIDISGAGPDRESATNGAAADSDAKPPAAEEQEGEADISEEEGRELLQSIVDFTETVVKEVMTPRPDIIAIPVHATLAELRSLFRDEQRHVLSHVLDATIRSVENQYREIYSQHLGLMQSLRQFDYPLPAPLRRAAEIVTVKPATTSSRHSSGPRAGAPVRRWRSPPGSGTPSPRRGARARGRCGCPSGSASPGGRRRGTPRRSRSP